MACVMLWRHSHQNTVHDEKSYPVDFDPILIWSELILPDLNWSEVIWPDPIRSWAPVASLIQQQKLSHKFIYSVYLLFIQYINIILSTSLFIEIPIFILNESWLLVYSMIVNWTWNESCMKWGHHSIHST